MFRSRIIVPPRVQYVNAWGNNSWSIIDLVIRDGYSGSKKLYVWECGYANRFGYKLLVFHRDDMFYTKGGTWCNMSPHISINTQNRINTHKRTKIITCKINIICNIF